MRASALLGNPLSTTHAFVGHSPFSTILACMQEVCLEVAVYRWPELRSGLEPRGGVLSVARACAIT